MSLIQNSSSGLAFDALTVEGILIAPAMLSRISKCLASNQESKDYAIQDGIGLREEIARCFHTGKVMFSKYESAEANSVTSAERFVEGLLCHVFGHNDLKRTNTRTIGDRSWPIRFESLEGRVPIVVVPSSDELDTVSNHLKSEGLQRTAFLTTQEYLNSNDTALWGICCNGDRLRLLRENDSFTRPAFIEANLRSIFSDDKFADFSALYLLLHSSRFGAPGSLTSDCCLEHWRNDGVREGVTARARLRDNVKQALIELGNGFYKHPNNKKLRMKLERGDLSLGDYFAQLLSIVYRMIFLFVAEDRSLLHYPNSKISSIRIYEEGYSMATLRRLAARRTTWDGYHDRWEGLQIVFSALARGDKRLALPALGGLFEKKLSSELDNIRIENRALMAAIFRLSWLQEGKAMVPVNWRDMETEELGSVYESLLELAPVLQGQCFAFAEGAETKGNKRKQTGSYYTPASLVSLLLDTTLEPVLDSAEARCPEDPVSSILKLSIVDPAAGSGHFLLGAARRCAGRIAHHRSGGVPSQMVFQQALRDVVSRCIYGVDVNPMAVELCKVALWIETLEPGKPLSLLDVRIRCGDSLIGVFNYHMLHSGIPDTAYTPLTGDDNKTANVYGKNNREQLSDKSTSGFFEELKPPPKELLDTIKVILDMPEDSLKEIANKKASFESLQVSSIWRSLKIASDLYIATFFLSKTSERTDAMQLKERKIPMSNDIWNSILGKEVNRNMKAQANKISRKIRAFHWLLEFPQVFYRGGFDAVVGNPPWGVLQLNDKEYFSSRIPEIAILSGEKRKLAISRLKSEEPKKYEGYLKVKREFESKSEFIRGSGKFKLTARGKLNTYSLFTELSTLLMHKNGRVGIIVPTGIATDDSTSVFFGELANSKRLIQLFDFSNKKQLFADVNSQMKFCVLTIGLADETELAFFLTDPNQLKDAERRIVLKPEQFKKFNPNTHNAPIFRTRTDAELTSKIYEKAPALVKERHEKEGGDINPLGISFHQGVFNMASDSKNFKTYESLTKTNWSREDDNCRYTNASSTNSYVPLYEAKMIHHYDHRWATFDPRSNHGIVRECSSAEKTDPNFETSPRYCVPEHEVNLRLARVPSNLKSAIRKKNENKILETIIRWFSGYFEVSLNRSMSVSDLREIFGNDRSWGEVLNCPSQKYFSSKKTRSSGTRLQKEAPLTSEDLTFIKEGPENILELAYKLIWKKQPRWLVGWHDICRSTDQRTVIATILPKVGAGHTLPLIHFDLNPLLTGAYVAMFSSLIFDYVARQKIGGVHLSYNYLKQLPTLPLTAFCKIDLEYISSRVLELTYTSHSMRPWAEDLGHIGKTFKWSESRRMQLRAELDAFFARKYGLTRDELRYVLDPHNVKGENHPSETFRVLKNSEENKFGEYLTQKLVLKAWDKLEGVASTKKNSRQISLGK